MPDAIDVARYMLATQGGMPGERITNLKLQKLLYYAQGFHLALRGETLFPERIKAWAHGPVVPSVWQAYRDHGADPLPKPTRVPDMSPEQREVIDSVAQSYGQYSAWRLRELTHEERPWLEAYDRTGVIATETMQEFFRSRL